MSFEAYTSGGRAEEMHVHIYRWPRNEKIIIYIMAKHVNISNSKKPS